MGRPPTTILRTIKFRAGVFPPPFTNSTAIQYAGHTSWTSSASVPARRTRVAQGTINSAVPVIQTRAWIGGFTEVRIVARVFADRPAGYLLCGFAHPTYDFVAAARLPDTYELIGGLTLETSPPTSPIVVPLAGPYAVSEWVPIHANFLDTEVQCAFYARNTAVSGSMALSLGACDIQLR